MDNIKLSVEETISQCAVRAAYEMNAKLIVVFTNSGNTAHKVRIFNPSCVVLTVTSSE